jgi:hypothetical protein
MAWLFVVNDSGNLILDIIMAMGLIHGGGDCGGDGDTWGGNSDKGDGLQRNAKWILATCG